MSGNVARDARKQQTLARLQRDVAAQVDKEKTQKVKQEKAYEARLEAEKGNPRCEECEICCEPRIPTRFVTCDDRRKPHRYCEVCVRQHLRETIFETNSPWIRCLGAGCVAFYKRADYERILEQDALLMRGRLETRALLKNVDGITPCPACDFAAFVDPGVEVFECRNPKCLKSFCMRCKDKPHPGISCVQAGKQKATATAADAKADPSKLLESLRRKVEDAVSEALIRRCADCNAPFVKDTGCNEMRCICGNVTCYACKAQHITHDHWFRTSCVHFESTEAREEQERKKAERDAIARVLREHPGSGLKEKDLKVGEVSEAVKRDDRKKKVREAKEMRGELWMPGMEIEGGDEDMMAEMQMQMAGVNFAGPPAGGAGFNRFENARAAHHRRGGIAAVNRVANRGRGVMRGPTRGERENFQQQMAAARLGAEHDSLAGAGQLARFASPVTHMHGFGDDPFFQHQHGFNDQFRGHPAFDDFGQPLHFDEEGWAWEHPVVDPRLEEVRERQMALFLNGGRMGHGFVPPHALGRRRRPPW